MRVRQAIPLYLSVSLCLVVAPLVGTSVNVFAASTLPVVTVSQGPGYTVTAPPPTAQKSDYVSQIPSLSSLAPMDATDSGNYNSTQDFASWSYSDSDQMAVESDITLSDAHKAYMSHLIARHALEGWLVEVLPDLRITVRAKHPSDIAVTTMGLYYRPSQMVPWQGWLTGSGGAAIGLLPAPGAKQIVGYIKVKVQWTTVAGRTGRGWSVFRIQSVGHSG